MSTIAIWLAIIGVGLTGIVTRCSFLFLGDRLKLPPAVEKALRHAPAADAEQLDLAVQRRVLAVVQRAHDVVRRRQ